MAIRILVNLYENMDSPLARNQYEDWFTVAFFGTCIDLCMRDIRLGTDTKRTDAPSRASANRKNRGRSRNTSTRKLIGRKIDGIIYIVDRLLEVGAIEAARSFKKYLHETFKMPKTLCDMLDNKCSKAKTEDGSAWLIQKAYQNYKKRPVSLAKQTWEVVRNNNTPKKMKFLNMPGREILCTVNLDIWYSIYRGYRPNVSQD